MRINKTSGLLEPVQFLSSLHCDERPLKEKIDLIVVHGISLPPNQFGGGAVQQFFCGKLNTSEHPYFETIATLKVSSHLFISRLGEIIQFVPFHKRAWHAGKSFFKTRENCNDFSIGIELEGADHIPYQEEQYKTLSIVTKLLMDFYLIPIDHIVGHSDIAPDRKTDPGPSFDWNKFRNLI